MLTQSRLYQEIHQQPDSLARLLDQQTTTIRALAHTIRDRGITNVVVAARGSSDNAGRYAQYLLGGVNHLPVALTTPSLFSIYQQPPRFAPDTLVLGISQSGKSPDIVSVLAEAERQGQLTAVFTNVPDSDLARNARHVIDLCAGEERSIAATKTYTGELAAIALLSALLSDDEMRLSALHEVPVFVQETLALNAAIAQTAERYRYMNDCVVIGRGYNYASAFEVALKLKELTYTMAEPYSSADFLHGPLALIQQGFPALVISPIGALSQEMLRFLGQLQEREAEILCISNDPAALAYAHRPLPMPVISEWLSPIAAVIPGQLFAMHLAYAKNYDPDHPRGLRKVTETR
ncbi:MAG: SIS domain-containing protein [Caldilineaceae bacterium]|nr:SIS domain-containing protein [Caldilineaceae bacterium]HRJ40986.1 SIS domain-containing protein [Caldilineaceae bacterium]